MLAFLARTDDWNESKGVITGWTNLKYEEEMDFYKGNTYNTRFNSNSGYYVWL